MKILPTRRYGPGAIVVVAVLVEGVVVVVCGSVGIMDPTSTDDAGAAGWV